MKALRRGTLPRCLTASPEFFEKVSFFQGIHARPKSVVSVAHDMPISCEVFHRIAFPNRVIAIDIVQSLVIEHKVAAIDPAFAILLLFVKVRHLISAKTDAPEPSRRTNRR